MTSTTYRIWFPDILTSIAGHLPDNCLPFLRLVDKATAAHFSNSKSVTLSKPVPPREFRWFISNKMRTLNTVQRMTLAKLTARSGSVENLRALLRRSEAHAWEFEVWDAAAGAGRLDVCRFLMTFYCPRGPAECDAQQRTRASRRSFAIGSSATAELAITTFGWRRLMPRGEATSS
ncbi:hypothetical protein TSOC_005127 [Tetrabaena socialis]|uniref:Uncharacterized protein n=1 Tax=Tetrabaena socialis TaxID=47790 RepID=A0A2J8A7A1_9CHLO|nr:hypothetical protein TSOC_005127 [Tetrabaena socialis]|eukprot:PNH08353.1 hypothetical protein TSOC_005127 [Tetrabaena socialis]